jgi:hypothetical protein
LVAVSVTLKSPGFVSLPVIRPVFASSDNPSGSPFAEYVIGSSPVAGIVNKNGLSGRTPKTRAPLIRGVAGGCGVRMSAAVQIDVTESTIDQLTTTTLNRDFIPMSVSPESVSNRIRRRLGVAATDAALENQ